LVKLSTSLRCIGTVRVKEAQLGEDRLRNTSRIHELSGALRRSQREVKSMWKHVNRRSYAIAAILIITVALTVAYRWHRSQIEHARHIRRPLQHDASSVVDSQMLQGRFGNAVSTQDRQAVEAELQASDQPDSAQTQAARTAARSGNQRIVLTQPLGTTVEETEPTVTWDTPFVGWIYRVHIEDRDSHQTVATSSSLDEALWSVSSPLLRGRTYLWRVEASAAGNHPSALIFTSATGQFSVLSEEGEQEIRKARAGNPSHLLLGSLYTHYQMWPEAVLEYRKLVDEVPDSPEAIKLLRNAELRSNAQLASNAPQ
jgi:hypothetical protein